MEQPEQVADQGVEGGGQVEHESPPPWTEHLERDFAERLGQVASRPTEDPQYDPGYEEPDDFDADYDDPDGDEFDLDAADDQFAGWFEDDPDDDSEDDADPYFGLLDEADERDRIAEEATAPYRQALADQEFAQLERDFPPLTDPRVAAEVADDVHDLAHELGQPALAEHPALVRMVFLAQHGWAAYENETPAAAADTSSVVLEQGGATPADGEPDGNVFQQMWSAKQRDANRIPWEGGSK